MRSIALDRDDWQKMRVSSSSDRQLSERTFHLIFSGALLWGLLLTYLLVVTLQGPIIRMMYNSDSAGGIMIGIIIAYFVCCIAGSFMLRSDQLSKNVIGFHLIAVPVGVVLSIAMTAYVGEPELVSKAVILTMSITAIMMGLAMIFPSFFQGIGRLLGVSLGVVIVVELVAALFFRQFFTITDYLVAGIMCLYIGFDWGRMTTCSRTARNAIAIAASLYLDIINLFLRILSILAKKKD